jgi:transcriptional regulator with XRE-family HTH domain
MCPMSDTNPVGQVPEWTLGWRMKRSLAYGKVSVETMAEHLGYERKALSRWMADKGAPPRPVNLMQWAMKCGVPYAWLIGQNDDGPSDLPIDESGYNDSGATVVPLRRVA